MDQSTLTGATDMTSMDNNSIYTELDRIDNVVYAVGDRERGARVEHK